MGLEKVGIHDNFFELGGHSLLGTQVLSRLQHQFELKLPLRAVFEAPTVAELEAIVTLAHTHRGQWVAIGEVGLDYWVARDETRRKMQRVCLGQMVDLARELSLPLNVHARSAGHHTLDLLGRCGAERVLMHGFDGKAGHAGDEVSRSIQRIQTPETISGLDQYMLLLL